MRKRGRGVATEQRPLNARTIEPEGLGAATRKEALLVLYAQEIVQAVDSHCRPTAALDPLAAVAVIGHLQFALRHVDREGAAAVMVRRFVDDLAAAFAEYPAVTEVIRRGWHQ